MLVVVAKAVYKDGESEKAIKLFKDMIQAVWEEDGCIKYNIYQDINDVDVVTVIEEWDSEEELKKHIQSEHYLRTIPSIRELRISSEINIYKKIV